MAVSLEGEECRIPDVVVTCAAAIDETARLVPEPMIVVEVASPSTRLADVNDKVEFYSGIASIRHHLVIEQDQRRVVCHGRGRAAAWSLVFCARIRSPWNHQASNWRLRISTAARRLATPRCRAADQWHDDES
jgi:Putative restriction endonuclease